MRRGGFGVVYLVRAGDTGERKVLRTYGTRLLRSDADRARFEGEALARVRLRPHRHVEGIEGLPCGVTEYAEGGDLAGGRRAAAREQASCARTP